MKRTISSLLSHGALNAIPAADITALTGLDARGIRFAVERERLSGTLILSDDHGYYLPAEDFALAEAEIVAWLSQRTAAATSIMKTVEVGRAELAKLRRSAGESA